jgi:hypothetical protein
MTEAMPPEAGLRRWSSENFPFFVGKTGAI